MKLGHTFTEWEIIQDDLPVATANDRAEIDRYAFQYVEDGDLEVWEIKKTLVAKFSSTKSMRKKK